MLKLAVIADRLPAAPWSHGPMAMAIAGGLAARGHEVTLLSDSVEDASVAARAGVQVRARSGYDHRARTNLKALQAWASGEVLGLRAQAVLSLARVPVGDVWMPLAAGGAGGRVVRRLGPGGKPLCWGAVLHDVKHWLADVRDARAERAMVRGADPARVLTWGERAARAACTALPWWAERVRAVASPTMHARPAPAELIALRARTRGLLGIEPDRLVVLISMADGVDNHLLPVLHAASHLHAGHRGRGPLLLITTNDGVAIKRAAEKMNASAAVRVASLSGRFDALLAASDLVATVVPRREGVLGGDWGAASPARFVSEAMAWSRPVLALRGAGGAELVGSGGLVVPEATGLAWYVALQTAMDPAWRVNAGVAARGVADVQGFSLSRVVDVVEEELARVAVERGGVRVEKGAERVLAKGTTLEDESRGTVEVGR